MHRKANFTFQIKHIHNQSSRFRNHCQFSSLGLNKFFVVTKTILKMRDMMEMDDYLSTIEDADFSKSILNYIRVKETLQFKEEIHKNAFMKNMWRSGDLHAFSHSKLNLDSNLMNYNNFDMNEDDYNEDIDDDGHAYHIPGEHYHVIFKGITLFAY